MQDSNGMMLAVVGPGNGSMMQSGISVSFIAPAAGDTVPSNFDIVVSATDKSGTISHVDVQDSGGQQIASIKKAPWRTSLSGVQDGDYQIQAVAFDSNGNLQATSVNFSVRAGAQPQKVLCNDDVDCDTGAGERCVNHQCVKGQSGTICTPACPAGTTCQADGTCSQPPGGATAPGTLGLGDSCNDNRDCKSAICGEYQGLNLCTQMCNPSDSSSCPSNMQCVGQGGQAYCAPKGGGCAVAANPTGGAFALLLWVLALAWVRRQSSF
jgi:hypothetical protein